MSTVIAKDLVFDGRGPQIFSGQHPDALPIFADFKGKFTTKASIDGNYRVNNQFLLGVLFVKNRKNGAIINGILKYNGYFF